MCASVGDRLVVKPQTARTVVRDGEILEVRGPDGEPPYLVRWADNGHLGLVYPGPDTAIQHFDNHGAEAVSA